MGGWVGGGEDYSHRIYCCNNSVFIPVRPQPGEVRRAKDAGEGRTGEVKKREWKKKYK